MVQPTSSPCQAAKPIQAQRRRTPRLRPRACGAAEQHSAASRARDARVKSRPRRMEGHASPAPKPESRLCIAAAVQDDAVQESREGKPSSRQGRHRAATPPGGRLFRGAAATGRRWGCPLRFAGILDAARRAGWDGRRAVPSPSVRGAPGRAGCPGRSRAVSWRPQGGMPGPGQAARLAGAHSSAIRPRGLAGRGGRQPAPARFAARRPASPPAPRSPRLPPPPRHPATGPWRGSPRPARRRAHRRAGGG